MFPEYQQCLGQEQNLVHLEEVRDCHSLDMFQDLVLHMVVQEIVQGKLQ